MGKIFIYLIANIIFLSIGINFQRITSLLGVLRFKLLRNKVNADKLIYSFAKEIMLKMDLNYKLHIVFNKKSKKPNADAVIYKNDLFIVLHGKWSNEQLKFVISHELAHIKLKHQENTGNKIFIGCLFLLCGLGYEVILFIYPNFTQSLNRDFLDSIFTVILLIAFLIIFYLENIINAKKSRQNEKDADLQVAKIIGMPISIDAISMLDDKGSSKLLSTHPTNKERIKYILNNFNY